MFDLESVLCLSSSLVLVSFSHLPRPFDIKIQFISQNFTYVLKHENSFVSVGNFVYRFRRGFLPFFHLKWHFLPNVQFIDISIPLPSITITFKFSNPFLFLPTHKFPFSGATCQSN
jgi:hypothetical protein